LDTDAKSGFIAKFDTLGNLIWFKSLLGTVSKKEITTDGIAIDQDKHIYITGKFVSGLKIGDQIFTEPHGKKSFYLAKFDEEGNLIWCNIQHSNNGKAEVEGKRIFVNKANKPTVCGKLKGASIRFGSKDLEYSTTATGENSFLVQYN
jgi:hypothetical protein